MVMTLLLIGIDLASSTELRRDILHSMSLLCCRLSVECEAEGIVRYCSGALSLSSQAHFLYFQGFSITERVLDLATSLSPSNQALLLSFFARGSLSSLRIARAVANHALSGLAMQPVSRSRLVHHSNTDATF